MLLSLKIANKGGYIVDATVLGYDKFTKEYGIASADLNANLQTYTTKNQIGEAYREVLFQ